MIFLSVMELSKDYIVADASFNLNKNRQIKLRKPNKLPLEQDITAMQLHILEPISAITKDTFNLWDNHTCIELRDCCCARLTLFNARRGGESTRLLLTEWKDVVNGSWLDQQHMHCVEDPIEKGLINSLRVTYQSGKGNFRLVPVFPEDSVQALMLLAYPENRKVAGFSSENLFLFPSTQKSNYEKQT